MIDLKKLIDERMQRVMLTVEAVTKKIIKKELNKFKRDIIKQLKDG